MLSQPNYILVAPYVNYWVVPSLRAKEYADLLNLPNIHIPYGIDTEKFFPIVDVKEIVKIKNQYNLPTTKYLIGSFQRDTEGMDLATPKYIKGPDIFLEIIRSVYRKYKDIHVVLAGPRRYWLRKMMDELKIPYTYIGEKIVGEDDLDVNTLDQRVINQLYNVLDLYLVTSRLEGGPKAILECAATKTKIISSDVGHAAEILNNTQIFTNIIDARDMITNDIHTNYLSNFIESNFYETKQRSLDETYKRLKFFYHIITNHTENRNASLFIGINKDINTVIHKSFKKIKKVIIHYQFHKPPWGGGNQFLLALSKNLMKSGLKVFLSLKNKGKVMLINSFHIDFKMINKINIRKQFIIHRIDGPTILVRGKDREIDDKLFEFNKNVAKVSVFQSGWSLFETLRLGYEPVNPILIPNASDNEIFHNIGVKRNIINVPIKLVSSSWSDNVKKGGPIYKWFDNNLDFSKFQYTFVGRTSEEFQNIQKIDPVSSDDLATILRNHDIYITASKDDPCSNAVIEALSCGLPVVYLLSGGHRGIVGYGGLGFETKEEVPHLLEMIIENYENFYNLIVPPDIKSITEKYIQCFELSNYG
jgi:glycosyltransferase involved in cell wall biosynthesis